MLVDSGGILIVDPAHLPEELLAALTTPDEHGVTLAVLTPTRHGDGFYDVLDVDGDFVIVDPYAELFA